MPAAASRLAAVVAVVAAFGSNACGGALTNDEWVHEPEPGNALPDDPHLARAMAAPDAGSDASAYLVSDAAPQAGPRRLDHTVTLGSVVATPADPAAAPASGPASITINVNNYVGSAPPAYGYGYGYAALPIGGRGFGGASTLPAGGGSHHGAASMQPGQSWPAAPSYGPSFPYSTSPASPWEHKR